MVRPRQLKNVKNREEFFRKLDEPDNKSLGKGGYLISPVCYLCKHLTGFRECKAFDRIPIEIWNGYHTHDTEYEGDNGIRFEPFDKLKNSNIDIDKFRQEFLK